MTQITDGTLLWSSTPQDIANANLTKYMAWLAKNKNLHFSYYDELWQWSVDHLELFWESLWSYFDLAYTQKWDAVLPKRTMPGAVWFPGVRLNYAENIFRKMAADAPVLLFKDENNPVQAITRNDLERQVRAVAQALQKMGVQPGDRVVAYLPNIPEAMIAMLASASLGAIWSSCPPDFGAKSVLDRFLQIEPKVLIATNGYQYGGKQFDRQPVLQEMQEALTTLKYTILLPYFDADGNNGRTMLWHDILAETDTNAPLTFAQLPFDHPLWILYSSGTTGLPKPIVQGHGGILLEHVKNLSFHNDLHPNDRFFWYSSTGWMMWNYIIGSLLTGCTAVLYNGSPAYPDMNALWQLAEETGMTYFGTSAAYISACIKAGIHPNQQFDLSHIRAVGSTGSPLTSEGFQWIYDNVNRTLALESLSGGTDLCTAFVGGCRLKPIYAGEIQGASLGAKVQAFNEAGQPVINEVGELVITEPMPSMPLYFWNDPEMKRYKESYFEMFPGVWRHGDWISFNERGGCVIYGRSDATINRQGIRMGTSEIYRIVESFPQIRDSLIIDLEMLGRESYLPLFVVLQPGENLTEELKTRINQKLRQEVSPRHVPNDIFAIEEVPYTLSGKKMEVPVRKILLGMDPAKAANIGAMRNPKAIEFFIDFAKKLNK
ncbi:MAG: acetoacetate--CoA ligase [Candidatus Promineifilaceae bacterium]